MSTRARCVTRQRKNQLHLDLNSVPSVYIEDQTGTSSQVPLQNNQATVLSQNNQATILPQNNQTTLPSQNNQATMQGQPVPPNMIDVEAIEDDVIIMSSPRAFAQAKNNSRRSRRRPIIDLDSERTKVTPNKRRKVASKQPINNCDDVIILEKSTEQRTVEPPPPPPPKKPIFSCPICMCPFVEEISTKCGHIFCKRCINAALKVKPLCPTCRRTVAKKDLMRVFLPTTTACC